MSGASPSGLPTGTVEVDPATAPYVRAAQRGELVLPWCADCAAPFWYPRAFCPRCGGESIRWRRSQGRGTVYSWTVVRRAGGAWAARVPFCVAIVKLDDGVAVTANVIGMDLADLSIGARVVAVFERDVDGDLPALRFTAHHPSA